MENISSYEILTIVISTIALTISLFSFINSLYDRLASQGQTELQIQQQLFEAEQTLLNIYMLRNKYDNKTYNSILLIGKQSYLNVFDSACAKYLDRRINKKRFILTYKEAVINLFEDDSFNYLIYNSNGYKALIKFYETIKK